MSNPIRIHALFFLTQLKNDLQIKGILKSVDQFMNIKLENVTTLEDDKFPHLTAVRDLFIRGSVVRYVHLPPGAVDTTLLEDATRREALSHSGKAIK